MTIDIFCDIIDNFGDIGFVYRLGNELKKEFFNRDIKASIRIFITGTSELTKLNSFATNSKLQVLDGVSYYTYDYLNEIKDSFYPADIIIESFACEIPKWYLDKSYSNSSLLINLEYLSSEDWTIDFHLKESLIGAKKLKKFFFIPGLKKETGGVLLNTSHDKFPNLLYHTLKFYNSNLTLDFFYNKITGTIFSYEHNFSNLFYTLFNRKEEYFLAILGEKTQKSMIYLLENMKNNILLKDFFNKQDDFYEELFSESMNNFFSILTNHGIIKIKNVYISFVPFLSQEKYDSIVNQVDFNFVRGEDSFVRGLLSKKTFLWQSYCQKELTHLNKIQGFLDTLLSFFNSNLFNFCNNDSEKNLKFNPCIFNNLNNKISINELNSILTKYVELTIQYNNREENSFLSLNSHESYDFFFSELDKLNIIFSNFSNYIKINCNLIVKLVDFIVSFKKE